MENTTVKREQEREKEREKAREKDREREIEKEERERQRLLKLLQRCMSVLDKSLMHVANAQVVEGDKAIAFE